jgi:hypothetical protein
MSRTAEPAVQHGVSCMLACIAMLPGHTAYCRCKALALCLQSPACREQKVLLQHISSFFYSISCTVVNTSHTQTLCCQLARLQGNHPHLLWIIAHQSCPELWSSSTASQNNSATCKLPAKITVPHVSCLCQHAIIAGAGRHNSNSAEQRIWLPGSVKQLPTESLTLLVW